MALATSGKPFEVVDRTHLKALLKEHKLASSGVIDHQAARRLGQIAGVEALVTGTVTPFGESVNLSVKVLDAATAKLVGASSVDVPRTKAIEELLSRGVEADTALPPSTPATARTPPRVTSKVQVRNLSFESLGCRASATVVLCEVIIVSLDADQTVTISGDSRIVDELGNEHVVMQIRFGATLCQKEGTGSCRVYEGEHYVGFGYGARSQLRSGVPVRAGLTFEGVSAVRTLALLDIRCESETRLKGRYGVSAGLAGENFAAALRNIPLEKVGARQ